MRCKEFLSQLVWILAVGLHLIAVEILFGGISLKPVLHDQCCPCDCVLGLNLGLGWLVPVVTDLLSAYKIGLCVGFLVLDFSLRLLITALYPNFCIDDLEWLGMVDFCASSGW